MNLGSKSSNKCILRQLISIYIYKYYARNICIFETKEYNLQNIWEVLTRFYPNNIYQVYWWLFHRIQLLRQGSELPLWRYAYSLKLYKVNNTKVSLGIWAKTSSYYLLLQNQKLYNSHFISLNSLNLKFNKNNTWIMRLWRYFKVWI